MTVRRRPQPTTAATRAHRAISEGRPREALLQVEPYLDGQPLEQGERASLLVARGNARSDLDDFGGSLVDLEEARRLYRETGQPGEAGKVDMEIGITLNRMGRPAEALQRHEHALGAYSEHGDALDVAVCKLNIAQCYAELGDSDRERRVLEQARSVFAEHGDDRNVLACTYNLALADWRVGRLSAARDTFVELLDEYAMRGLTRQLADAKDVLGSLLHEFGEVERSVALHRDAAATYEVLGLPAQRCSALVSLAHTLAHAGQLDEAEVVLDTAGEIAESPGSVAHVRFEQAWMAIRRSRPRHALRIVEALEQVDRARGAEAALPYRLWTTGVAQAALGDPAAAIGTLQRAVTGLRAVGAPVAVAEATRELGHALRSAGDGKAAADALCTAADLFGSMGLEHRARQCREDLTEAG